jgi:CheY-like chemotaxis protein
MASKTRPRALIVENNRDVSRDLALVLEDLGFQAFVAQSIDEAIMLIEKHTPAAFTVSTLDLELAGDSGLALVDRYPALFGPQNSVIITGYPDRYELAGKINLPPVLRKDQFPRNPYDALKDTLTKIPSVARVKAAREK